MGVMHDQSDAQLLRAYAERGVEAAFAEIVARHTDLVYSAALRQVYAPDLARDVTQSVFTDLARKARSVSANLSPEASLVGWLYRGTRFAARDLYRNETRRTQRERQAMAQLHPTPETPPDWEQLRPALDDAMSELDDSDRDAVLLRYFKNHDLRTVGATLGISDDAAQKRVSRAVERLREFFAKRGVTVGAGGLTVVISANAVQAAPVGLALTISTAAVLTGTTLATTTTLTATKAIAMTTLQKTIVVATVTVLAGAGIYETRQASQLREQNQVLQQQQASLAEQIQTLQNDLADATSQLADLAAENTRMKSNPERNEILRLRGQVATAARAAADAAAKTPDLRNGPEQSGDSQRNQTRANLETFFKLTNLSREKADQYVDLEVEMKRRQDERMKALLGGTLSVAEAVRQRDQDKQAQEDQRRALLGPNGSTVLDSIADGMRDGVAKRLTSAVQASLRDNPLTQEQSDRLQSAIKAEVAANSMDDTDLFRPEAEWTQMATDHQQHVLQAASEFLTPTQQQTLQFLVGENLKQMLQQRDQRRKALGIKQ